MVDLQSIQSQIYRDVSTAVREAFPEVHMASQPQRNPSAFPFVSLTILDVSTDNRRVDSSLDEKYVYLVYQADVYSAAPVKKLEQCMGILRVIRERMFANGFRCTAQVPASALDYEGSIYRTTARFSAETDGKHFYGA